mgnify:CR=1 FL=1
MKKILLYTLMTVAAAGMTACEDFLKTKLVAELFADLIEHEHSLGYDLRADAIALDNSNIVIHGI